MISSDIKNNLKEISNINVKFNEPLKNHTTFKIGGPADIFLTPNNIAGLKKVLTILQNLDLPIFILGKGSNVIVGDKGFRGLVINTENLDKIRVESNHIISETGIPLSKVCEKSLESSLTGLEFASGIPGTLGGAIYMNAGAYGGIIADVLEEVVCLDYSGNEIVLSTEELKLDYRHSLLQDKDLIAVKAKLKLKQGEQKKIKSIIDDLTNKRWTKQPMEIPSAGSIFKRPQGYYASALIDQAGLKGFRIGDAQVSKKHAGFIVNLGHATAKDVQQLIKEIQKDIYLKNKVRLEVEPRFIGEFEETRQGE